MNKVFDCAFEIKAISDSGTFSGYGSVFGVVDSYGDVVAPGAFADSLADHKGKNRLPAMLWQHRSAEPLGIYTAMHEDAVGLQVEGKLALTTVRGAEAHALMKMGALTGLSIGYQVRTESFDKVSGINTLSKVDLWEVSPVTFPANDAARINGVKTIELIMSLRDAEGYLRDVGLGRTEARAFLARLKSLGQRDADEGALEELAALTKRSSAALAALAG
jgi:HK97 family phage prohead protease